MEYKVFESVLHPIRMKIIQEIIKKEKATTKDISLACSDVAQATLYRNINKLLKDNIIIVDSENKIRGVSEKVYKININPYTEVENILKENDVESILNLFYQFSMGLMGDFQSYATNEESDFEKDVIGFRSYPMYLSDEESLEMMLEIRESISKRIDNKNKEDRKLRKLSTVFVPIKEK